MFTSRTQLSQGNPSTIHHDSSTEKLTSIAMRMPRACAIVFSVSLIFITERSPMTLHYKSKKIAEPRNNTTTHALSVYWRMRKEYFIK